jgi:Domain of unknown function (DUF5753)
MQGARCTFRPRGLAIGYVVRRVVTGARGPVPHSTAAAFGAGATSAAHARTVLRAYYRSEPPEQIERRVKLRMARQQLVIEQTNTPIWAVLDESVLRRHIGPAELMQAQYRRLLELSEKNNITIQILPFDAGVYSIPGGFTIMQLPDPDPEVVVIEYRSGTLRMDHPEEVAMHALVFDRLKATAKGPEESLSYISHLAELDVE